MENGPGLKMYFLLKMGKFIAMLVYQRVEEKIEKISMDLTFWKNAACSRGTNPLNKIAALSNFWRIQKFAISYWPFEIQ